MLPLAVTVGGLVLLVAGAERVVRDGSLLAARLRVSPMVIGLTVVSVGTSLPELAVGVSAVRRGDVSIAIGTIVGTNLVNILLVLGLAALLAPVLFERRTLRFDLPALVGASGLFYVLARDGELSVVDGAVLLAYAGAYVAGVVVLARRDARRDGPTVVSDAVESGDVPESRRALGLTVLTLVLAMAVLVVGAELLVGGASDLASRLGASEALIGLTVVAIGTSAPELATTIVSTIRGDRSLALGNLLGSSVLNIGLILGFTLVIAPGASAVPPEVLEGDLALMGAAALLCVPVFLTGRRMSRAEGGLFVGLYAAYLAWVLASRL